MDYGTAFLEIPGGLVVRIRRSHRRGRGSIPRLGMDFWKIICPDTFRYKNVGYIFASCHFNSTIILIDYFWQLCL